MRTLPLALLGAALATAGCTAGTYSYSFDLTDPGAQNVKEPGQRDTLEDGDVKSEILVDPVSFRAIAVDFTNKTDQILLVQWDNITFIGPDGNENKLHPDSQIPPVEPGARVSARLVTFALPADGALAAAYDKSKFEVTIPMVVRGVPHVYRYHLLARTHKL